MKSDHKPTTSELYKIMPWLQEEFPHHFITGGVAFGTATDISDIDVALTIADRLEVCSLLKTHKFDFEESEYNRGFKMKRAGIVINFVFLHPVDFVAWFYAARMIAQTDFYHMLENTTRISRLAFHESLCGAIKGMLGYHKEGNIGIPEAKEVKEDVGENTKLLKQAIAKFLELSEEVKAASSNNPKDIF